VSGEPGKLYETCHNVFVKYLWMIISLPSTLVTEATVRPPGKTYVTTWTDPAVHALMNAMGAFIDDLSKKRTPRTVYEKISAKLLEGGYQFTPDAVYFKKGGCETTYRRVLKKHLNGQVRWAFFDAMQHLRAGHWPKDFVSGANCSTNSSINSSNNSLSTLRALSFHTCISFLCFSKSSMLVLQFIYRLQQSGHRS